MKRSSSRRHFSVERRAIRAREKPPEPIVRTPVDAPSTPDLVRPLAAEVSYLLRERPLRFPAELWSKE